LRPLRDARLARRGAEAYLGDLVFIRALHTTTTTTRNGGSVVVRAR
jgi:hypothetical protein